MGIESGTRTSRGTLRENSTKPARSMEDPSPAFGKPSNTDSNSSLVSSSSLRSSDTSLHLADWAKRRCTRSDVGYPRRRGRAGGDGEANEVKITRW